MTEGKEDKIVGVLHLMKLKHLHQFMTQAGWEDRSDAGGDDWVCRQLDTYKCFSRDDVKNRIDEMERQLRQ
jgi:hypothetical protein